MTLNLPPLSERVEDIPLIVRDVLNRMGGEGVRCTESAMNALMRYPWPGNIRELHNKIERAMNYASDDADVLRPEHFNWRADNSSIDLEELTQFDNPIEMIKKEAERKLINEVLMRFDRNKTKTADYLKIPRPLLYQKMKRLGIRL